VRRNELASKLPFSNITTAMKNGSSPVEIFIEDDRQQRAALILRNVAYMIDAHFEFTGPEDRNEGKHLDIFNRRIREGKCFHRPLHGVPRIPCGFRTRRRRATPRKPHY
jgi:CRISPR-associated protein Cas5d